MNRPRFDLATDADEPEIRRILRDNPMPGTISLSLEREPDSRVAARVEGPILHQTIVGRRAGGGLFGFGTRAIRTMFLNGEPRPVGYLGALRLDADHRGDAAALRQGYRLFRALHERDGLTPIYLTSILADNANARRLLEANLPGMPTYRPLGELVTFVMPVRRPSDSYRPSYMARRKLDRFKLRLKRAWPSMQPAIEAFRANAAARSQFATSWIDQPMAPPTTDACVVLDSDDAIVGCAALWDQRAFKQTVVRGYAPRLARWRRPLNVARGLLGHPPLPEIGAPIRSASVASLLTDPAVDPRVAVALVESIHAIAGTRGLDYLSVGLPAGDARLAAIRAAFGGREIRSRLYVAFWPDAAAAADALDGRPLGPEVALL